MISLSDTSFANDLALCRLSNKAEYTANKKLCDPKASENFISYQQHYNKADNQESDLDDSGNFTYTPFDTSQSRQLKAVAFKQKVVRGGMYFFKMIMLI